MRPLKLVITALIIITIAFSCNSKASKKDQVVATLYQCPMHCEGDKTYEEPGNCPVCEMELVPVSEMKPKTTVATEISDESIFNLTSKWRTEENKEIQLKDLKGKTVVMVMIYTSCKAACPRLVADMRGIEDEIPDARIKDIQFVFVSIDPKVDTPERLKAFAKENYMDDEQWMFLQGTESSVREFANVLSVKYKEISPIDFSHSNIISVFNPEGELVHQQEGLGVNNAETVKSLMQLTQ